MLKAFARKGLAIIGTFLITHGMLTTSADSFASTYMDEAVGLLLIGASAVWTAAYQWYVRRKVVTALELPKGASPTALDVAMNSEKGDIYPNSKS
jgi:hypothetical protein